MSDVNSEIEQLKQQLKDANNQTELANKVILQANKIIKQLLLNIKDNITKYSPEVFLEKRKCSKAFIEEQ